MPGLPHTVFILALWFLVHVAAERGKKGSRTIWLVSFDDDEVGIDII